MVWGIFVHYMFLEKVTNCILNVIVRSPQITFGSLWLGTNRIGKCLPIWLIFSCYLNNILQLFINLYVYLYLRIILVLLINFIFISVVCLFPYRKTNYYFHTEHPILKYWLQQRKKFKWTIPIGFIYNFFHSNVVFCKC